LFSIGAAMLSFRLWTIFYVFALSAAAMATFGPWGGIFASLWVLVFWGWMLYRQKTRQTALAMLSGAFLVLLLIGLLLPAMSSARAAARRTLCASHLRVIAVALHNYHDTNGAFPPAYVSDANGKPMHSWRVLILPFMDVQSLYGKYKFNEPWDGPNNSKLAAQIPAVYRCPANANNTAGNLETHYFAVLAPEAGWGKSIRQFSDGSSNTIMVIEATGLGINWMEPRDVTLDEAIELLTTKKRSGHTHVDDGFLTTTYYETSYRNVAYCDGHVEWMGQLKDSDIAKALFTIAGGERMDFVYGPSLLDLVEPMPTTVVKWGKIWGLSVFVVLALLPAAWIRRRTALAVRLSEDERVKTDDELVSVAAGVGSPQAP
jgi:prepilin-type processing-associated H-X9-DG protein